MGERINNLVVLVTIENVLLPHVGKNRKKLTALL